MSFILNLFKRRKLVKGIGIFVLLCSTLIFGWVNIKKGIYNDGYQDAVIEYQTKLAKQQKEYDEYVVRRLEELKKDLEYQHNQELLKIQKESKVDDNTRIITEYIKEKVYVQDNCNVVPVELNSLFNDSIHSINGNKQD